MDGTEFRETIRRVKEGNDILKVIGERVDLSPQHKALCPFHQEERPSFSVNPQGQYYYCFGCHAHGDVIDFIQQYENKTFMEAVAYLAEGAGISLPSLTPEAGLKVEEDRTIDRIRMEAVILYHQSLTPDVRSYLTQERGLGPDIVTRFQIGYANGGLRNHLIARHKFPENLCLRSGMLKRTANGMVVDYFYHEIIFPNWHSGRVVYVTGRGYPKKSHRKPRHELLPLDHLFCEQALKEKEVVLTEGETDTYTLIQSGFNACGILGVTSFKDGWVAKFKNVETVYVSLDGDPAGVEAALRLGNLLGDKARIVPLPDSAKGDGTKIKDWNELFVVGHHCNVQSFRDEFQRCLDHAQTVLECRIRQIPKGTTMRDLPRVLSPVIAELTGLTEIEQDFYVEVIVDHFRDTLKLSKQAVRNDVRQAARRAQKAGTEQVEILDEKYPRVSPALDFVDGTGYVCVPVDVKLTTFVKNAPVTRVARVPYVVTSRREFFRLDKEQVLEERRLLVKSEPHFLDGKARWSIEHIRQFQDEGFRVEPAVVFGAVRNIYDSYVDFKDPHTAEVIALWTVGTYMFPVFQSYPYLSFTGEKASGKTKTLNVAEKLCFNAICSSDMSSSLLFRIIEGSSCTVLMDEAERLKDPKLSQDFGLLLNAGYKRGGRAHRSKPDTFEPQSFEVYSPKMVANIKGLEEVLESRCIQFTMLRTRDIAKANKVVTETSEDWAGVRHMLYALGLTAFQEIGQEYLADGEIKSIRALSGRQGELWHPILAIAQFLDKKGCQGLFETVKGVAIEKGEEAQAGGLDYRTNALLLALRELTANNGEHAAIGNKRIRETMPGYLEDDSPVPSSRWIGGKMKRLGLVKGKPEKGRDGYRYVVSRVDIEDVMERYGV